MRIVPRIQCQIISGASLSLIAKIMRDESGATAVEYGLIAALISVAAIAAFTTTGTKLSTVMVNAANKIK
ncbi:MAG: Flp family type IVb pilin [Alphaproteobacteria bacterium]|nr:Flp family type IVb pilin [Alphaproteobacteria bacterium]